MDSRSVQDSDQAKKRRRSEICMYAPVSFDTLIGPHNLKTSCKVVKMYDMLVMCNENNLAINHE